MNINIKSYQIRHAKKNILHDLLTREKTIYSEENQSLEALKKAQHELAHQQELLFAQRQWSVLVVLQGMDTAGKDSLIEHVMKGINPQGCDVTSFKRPTVRELSHDFLWRAHLQIPERGKIGVFNRSYYEDIIVPYVHSEVLESSSLPEKVLKSKEILKHRCLDVINFEKYLLRQGVLIIKIFLHLSKGEQKTRLLSRLETPSKNWKFEASDIRERKFWKSYQQAYNFCFERTSHEDAPWNIIPADDKTSAHLIASKIITYHLEDLKLKFPEAEAEVQKKLKKFKHDLKKG